MKHPLMAQVIDASKNAKEMTEALKEKRISIATARTIIKNWEWECRRRREALLEATFDAIHYPEREIPCFADAIDE